MTNFGAALAGWLQTPPKGVATRVRGDSGASKRCETIGQRVVVVVTWLNIAGAISPTWRAINGEPHRRPIILTSHENPQSRSSSQHLEPRQDIAQTGPQHCLRSAIHPRENSLSFKRTVVLVAILNLSYFGIEFITARRIGSVSLLADSIDFLEDASINLLIVAALGMTLVWRARVGMTLAGILLIPAGVTLWTAWEKLRDPVAPDPLQLSLVGLGALAVNLACALLLVRFRAKQGSLARAAFLSARNDAIANIAIIAAGLVTAFLIRSAWPDLIVGLGIAALNADAAHEVFTAAKAERVEAQA